MIKSIIAWFAFLTFVLTSEALYADTLTNPIQFSGYIETYYGYDFSNPDELSRPDFLYSYHSHNEVNLNLGYI
jgi:hypothetical protein